MDNDLSQQPGRIAQIAGICHRGNTSTGFDKYEKSATQHSPEVSSGRRFCRLPNIRVDQCLGVIVGQDLVHRVAHQQLEFGT